jgi:hypothetical protein
MIIRKDHHQGRLLLSIVSFLKVHKCSIKKAADGPLDFITFCAWFCLFGLARLRIERSSIRWTKDEKANPRTFFNNIAHVWNRKIFLLVARPKMTAVQQGLVVVCIVTLIPHQKNGLPVISHTI